LKNIDIDYKFPWNRFFEIEIILKSNYWYISLWVI
jgi:hypothetical protein